jgi:hypothetical protein
MVLTDFVRTTVMTSVDGRVDVPRIAGASPLFENERGVREAEPEAWIINALET